MALPDFTSSGDLPIGIHRATVFETIARFGRSTLRRRVLASRLQRIFEIAQRTGCLRRFIIFGSFVTNKPAPNDIDIFMIMNDEFDLRLLEREQAILFDHTLAGEYFGCSVFWIRKMAVLDSEEQTAAHWQIKRDGQRRGIIEVEAQIR